MRNVCKIIFVCFALILYVPYVSMAQTAGKDQPAITIVKMQGDTPSQEAEILNYTMNKTDPNDYIATDSLVIKYSDGAQVTEKIPPAEKSTEKEIVFNEVGFSDVKISSDKRVIGWAKYFENCCTSYPVPQVLAIYQSGKEIINIQQGQMLKNWVFLDDKTHVVAIWGPVHWVNEDNYQLYDIKTGRLISEFSIDEDDNSKPAKIPNWVKQTDKKIGAMQPAQK